MTIALSSVTLAANRGRGTGHGGNRERGGRGGSPDGHGHRPLGRRTAASSGGNGSRRQVYRRRTAQRRRTRRRIRHAGPADAPVPALAGGGGAAGFGRSRALSPDRS